MGALVLLSGFALAILGATWPTDLIRSGGRLRIDEFMPAYQFHEVHSTRVHAPPERVFRAIKAVTPQEIRFFRTLMAIRELPARLLAPRSLMPNYAVQSRAQKDFDSHEFSVGGTNAKRTRVEGKKTSMEYEIKKGARAAAAPEIIRTYEDAVQRVGGSVVAEDDCCNATLKIGREGSAIWIEVATSRGGRGATSKDEALGPLQC